jgi:hypothetical protein
LHRQPLTRGIVRDRRGLLAVTTTSGARRLSIDRNDVMPGFYQAGEAWHREFGRAHESKAQAHASVFSRPVFGLANTALTENFQ